MKLWLLLCLAVNVQAGPLFQAQGLTVSAHQSKPMDGDFGEYLVQVDLGGQSWCFQSNQVGEAAQQEKALAAVRLQDGYAFVPDSCGGGNASKCEGYQVFRLGGHPAYLGNLTGAWNGSDVTVLEHGRFYDTGDQLEINDLTNHAEAPRYQTVYTDHDGLRFEAALTWSVNQAHAADIPGPAGLLYRAGLAKLCARTAEWRKALAEARKTLSPLQLGQFQSSLKAVAMGQSQPRAFLPVWHCENKQP
ncbi:MAG TPA: hypothetical protein VNZ67_12940 [bacterium]|nr:hypothetical protein [bacterium]